MSEKKKAIQNYNSYHGLSSFKFTHTSTVRDLRIRNRDEHLKPEYSEFIKFKTLCILITVVWSNFSFCPKIRIKGLKQFLI